MAKTTTLEGIRSEMMRSVAGRKLGYDKDDFIVGPKDIRVQVDGVTAGTTLTSTAVTTPIPAYGVTLVGASGASGTTAYILASPMPGVMKTLVNATTGIAVVITTTDTTGAGAGAMVVSSGSVTSTFQTLTMAGKGVVVQLQGLTTALWALAGPTLTSVTTMLTVA